MKKQPERTDATRKALASAFCQLSEQNPDKNITVRQIADCAGYNRTTFYRYFSDVISLREYLEDTLIHAVKDRLKELGGSEMSDSFFKVFLEVFEEEKPTFRILLRGSNRSHFIHKIQNTLLPTACNHKNAREAVFKTHGMRRLFDAVFLIEHVE